MTFHYVWLVWSSAFLQREGTAAFAKSWSDLMLQVASKRKC